MSCFPRKIETNDTIPRTPLQTYSNNDLCPTDVPFLVWETLQVLHCISVTCLPSLLQSEIDSPSLDTLKEQYGFMSLRRCWIKNSGLSHQEILDFGHSPLTLGYSIKPFYLYETKFISLINMELDNIKGFSSFLPPRIFFNYSYIPFFLFVS